MPKIILLNGPPHCGKDFAAAALLRMLANHEGVLHLKMSDPLKEIASLILGEPRDDLEKKKEQILPFGASYRDVQITLFETIAQSFGKNWLGKAMTSRIQNSDSEAIVVSDCGRDEELIPLIQAFGAKNLFVIQIFRDGCDFNYDIRHYVTNNKVRRVSINNEGNVSFVNKINNAVLDFLA